MPIPCFHVLYCNQVHLHLKELHSKHHNLYLTCIWKRQVAKWSMKSNQVKVTGKFQKSLAKYSHYFCSPILLLQVTLQNVDWIIRICLNYDMERKFLLNFYNEPGKKIRWGWSARFSQKPYCLWDKKSMRTGGWSVCAWVLWHFIQSDLNHFPSIEKSRYVLIFFSLRAYFIWYVNRNYSLLEMRSTGAACRLFAQLVHNGCVHAFVTAK